MSTTSSGTTHKRVFAVTVTYGQRRELLSQMLAGTLAEGISDFIVVDNGAGWDVAELIPQFPTATIRVVPMGTNRGSASGFASGISAAMNEGADMIWLLDDDNQPQKNSMASLLRAYEALIVGGGGPHNTSVLAFRPEHQTAVAMGVPARRVNVRNDSFCGFNVLDIPYKVWRRTPWGRKQGVVPDIVRLRVAPYSGLLFARELILAVGLPKTELVLYADDTEFTWRITAAGGTIALVTKALIDDLESSWNIKALFRNSFSGWLEGAGDFRAYYGMRNYSYVDSRFRSRLKPLFILNRSIYIILLWVFSKRWKKQDRYNLLTTAIKDGIEGRLGINPGFPLL